MKKPFYPFLLVLFPVLFLYSRNMKEIPLGDILLPMLVLVVGMFLLMLLLRLLTKDYNKIALAASSFLVVSFLYIPIRDLFPSLIPRGVISHAILWGFLYVIPTFLILKLHINFTSLIRYLNVVAITLLLLSGVNIGINQIRVPEPMQVKINEILTPPKDLPDIYYIVLDEYARDDYLEEVLGYNNELTSYLTNKGFYIATKSLSPYPATVPSLASSLNMERIDVAELSYAEMVDMLQNSKVSQLLKSMGYQYIFITSGALEGHMGRYAEVHAPSQELFGVETSGFAIYILQSTTIAPYTQGWIRHTLWNNILYSFDEIAKMPNVKTPTFVFAHILSPHPPYVFDRDGNPIGPFEHLSLEENREKYLDQLIFTNKKVKVLVDILLESKIPPIIIIQGDHGFRCEGGERMYEILNAYYLPGEVLPPLYESISPVNTFRVIFNSYFGTNYELLEDK